jgi:ectoine hydroxylase-related dioxygenase (phytanoyl-CoA dioxygenase family)
MGGLMANLTTAGLTEEQRLFAEANGYLVVPNALEADELTRLRAAADRAETVWRADESLAGWRRPNIQQIQSVIEYGDEFLELAAHPAIFPVVRDLLGDDVSLLFSDYFITPPHASSQVHWHRDARILGPYQPRSRMFAKAFILLSDVTPEGGGTAVVPGTHRFDEDWEFPTVDNPTDMPGHVKLAFPAGTIWFMHGRTYHAALPNDSDHARRVLIYSYGHLWMKPWQGYEPSPELQAKADTAVMRQLLHIGDPYRYDYRLDDEPNTVSADDEYEQRQRQKQGKGLR